eukprot:s4303_g3.t1
MTCSKESRPPRWWTLLAQPHPGCWHSATSTRSGRCHVTSRSVGRSLRCEVQGATVDGLLGVAYPREVKMAKYFGMALDLCSKKVATQKQWQVVCGGLVYMAMFRRPLLGGLNFVWTHIESLECKLEVLRFLGCLPLARLDFRLDMHEMVTCSDASSTGGGVCASAAETPFGKMVSEGALRGELAEHSTDHMVLTVGLFDGIGALRVALDVLGAHSVEKAEAAQRVVEAHYFGVMAVHNVEDVPCEMVKTWSTRFQRGRARGWAALPRPRLYWVDWELDREYLTPGSTGSQDPDRLCLMGDQDISEVTRQGWLKVEPAQAFPTFTTSQPQDKPGRKPAHIQHCTAEELKRWAQDSDRFPPHQYKQLLGEQAQSVPSA